MEYFIEYVPVYSAEQENLIDEEFQRIKDECFLDHTGGTLYSERQIEDCMQQLKTSIFCNPHATNGPSQQTEDAIDIVRFRILQHFHTNSEDYSVIFTSNATAALKLVAENFDQGSDQTSGSLVYLEDNHTSVLGMRSYFGKSSPLTVENAFKILQPDIKELNNEISQKTNSLFVYPAKSNFSGTKYPLEWIHKVHNGQLNNILDGEKSNWFVVLDAASFIGMDDLDLSNFKPDFVTVSFYKIFGYPTGLGALLLKNSSSRILKKRYYGGGTVSMVMALENVAILRNSIPERFEEGTIQYLSILSLNHGFNTLSRLNIDMKMIREHTFKLASYVFQNLIRLHHSNERRAVVLYHDTIFEDSSTQGAIVNFNLLRSNGDFIGYSEVLNMANLHKIHLRTGCSCNPGACQRHLKLTRRDVEYHFQAGHECGDQKDLINGIPTGSVRISFGYMSKKKDAEKLLQFIEECFIEKPTVRKLPKDWKIIETKSMKPFHTKNAERIVTSVVRQENVALSIEAKCLSLRTGEFETTKGVLKHLLLYPIKSCGAFAPTQSWKVCSSGLDYDRKWMIVNSSGSCVTQKQFPYMCLIKPVINLQNARLQLTFPDEDSIYVKLHDPTRKQFQRCESKVCRDKVIGFDCGEDVGHWISRCLGAQGLRLIEQIEFEKTRINKKGEKLDLSFANQSQYLLINIASVQWLKDRVQETSENYTENLESIVLRFRPNFVVDLEEPFIENDLDSIQINSMKFHTVGKCTRCQMICINQVNAQKTKEPLITLGREFGGKVQFGIYLQNDDFDIKDSSLDVGTVVKCFQIKE